MSSTIASPETFARPRSTPGTPSLRSAWLGSLATNLAIMATGIATGVLSARLLGPEERGALAFIQFWPPLLAALCSMSLGEAVVRRWAVTQSRRALTATSLAAATITVLAGAVLGFLLPLIARSTGRTELAVLLFAYHLAFLPLALGSSVLLGLDQAAQRWSRVNLVRLLPSSTYLAGIAVLWSIDSVGVATLVWSSLVGSLAVLAIQLYQVRSELRSGIDPRELRELFRTGARFHAANLLALLASQLDRLWLVLFFDDRALGLFAAATTFAASGIGAIVGALQLVLFPRLASRAADAPAAARAELEVALRRTTLLLIVCCGSGALPMPWLVPLLFGEAFAPAGWPAAVLMLAQIPACLRQTALRSVRAFGDARTGAVSEIALIAAFPLLAWGLGASWGLSGIALAVLIAHAAALVPVAVSLRRRHGIAGRSWLVPGPAMIRDGWAAARGLIAPVLAR